MTLCSYCNTRRAVNMDHIFPKRRLKDFNADRRMRGLPQIPKEYGQLTVPACLTCNVNKGQSLFVPPSWTDRIEELSDFGLGTFSAWPGIKGAA